MRLTMPPWKTIYTYVKKPNHESQMREWQESVVMEDSDIRLQKRY
jgi:hypothetical protein